VKAKFHSTDFLAALAMKPPATWRVANVIKPVMGDFLVSSRFFCFPYQSVPQRRDWKSKRAQWGDCISPKSLAR
jgi:hypothetical protein